MVDQLAEKFDECPLNWGHYVLNWGREPCPLYGVAGYSLFRHIVGFRSQLSVVH